MNIDPQSLVGSTVLRDLQVDALVRVDGGALATYAATSADGACCTLRVALAVRVESFQDGLIAGAFSRVVRHSLGIRSLAAPRAAGSVALGSDRLLALAHAGSPKGSAEDRIHAAQPATPAQVSELLGPIAQALVALHDQGLVHGAVHPAAIGIETSGPVLSAYGLSEIAHALGGTAAARDAVPARSRVPEQVGIVPSAPGPEADIYALAMVACELLAGRPFTLEQETSSIARAIDNPVLRPTPAALAVALPEHVEKAFGMALRTQPRERELSPAQLVAALTAPAPAKPVADDGPSTLRAGATPSQPRVGAKTHTTAKQPLRDRERAQTTPHSGLGAPEQAGQPQRSGGAALWLVWVFIGAGILLLVGGAVTVFVLAMLRVRPATVAPTATVVASATAVPAVPSPSQTEEPTPTAPLPTGSKQSGQAPGDAGPSATASGQAGPKLAGASAALWPDDITALIPISKDTPVIGTRDALVTVMLFADMECPYTRRARIALDKLATRYGVDLRIAVRHLPIPSHPHAELAAEIAAAAGALANSTALWKVFTSMTDNQSSLTEADMFRWAEEAGVPATALRRGVEEHAYRRIVELDKNLAGRLMVRDTPTFFINGEKIDGMESDAMLIGAIDKELVAARAALSGGTPKPKLYATRVKFHVTSAAADPRPPPTPRTH